MQEETMGNEPKASATIASRVLRGSARDVGTPTSQGRRERESGETGERGRRPRASRREGAFERSTRRALFGGAARSDRAIGVYCFFERRKRSLHAARSPPARTWRPGARGAARRDEHVGGRRAHLGGGRRQPSRTALEREEPRCDAFRWQHRPGHLRGARLGAFRPGRPCR